MSDIAPTIRIAARRSPLAVVQAEVVAARLGDLGATCELVGIDSQGDTDRRHLTEIGGTGVFAMAVREALRDGRADVAVHSMKDLPTGPAPGLELLAVPPREDPRDVLVGHRLSELADGMVIGTGSPRRQAQLSAYLAGRGIDVELRPIRGNVGTRLGLVRSGEVDAIVLAAAGLGRLGLLGDLELTVAPLAPEVLMPAPAQGALAVEVPEHLDEPARRLIAQLDDPVTRAAVTAERALLRELEAGCLAPVGALALPDGADLTLQAVIGRTLVGNSAGTESSDPLIRVRATATAGGAAELGRTLARAALARMESDHDEMASDR